MFFFHTERMSPLVDGDALADEFLEGFGLRKIQQVLLDLATKASVERGDFGVLAVFQWRNGLLELRGVRGNRFGLFEVG